MRITFLPLIALFFAGCAGYTLGPIKPTLMRDVSTLAVSNFKNETLEPRVEVLLANTLIQQLQRDGTYKITDEKRADAVVECTLLNIERRPSRSLNGNYLLAREYQLTLRTRFRVYKRDTGVELLARTVTGTTSFFVNGSGGSVLDADVNQDERQAIPLAAEDMIRSIVTQISEGW